MYPSDAEQAVLAAAEALMQQTMAAYDPSHDAFHVHRVRRTALALARAHADLAPDLLTVELAALLHDILDSKYAPAAASADPYAFFAPFFAPHLPVLDAARVRLIIDIVENISWTKETRLRKEDALTTWHATCLELHCVQDADRLDAIGAFGIMRCAAFSAATNRPLHVPADSAASSSSAIQHFHDKLLKIKDRLKTVPGKRLGEQRHQFMLQFLGAVEGEYEVDKAML